jgi:hypothetical protein
MDKQKCKLCNCEGVDGALLCKDHLEGFQFACEMLRSSSQMLAKNYLLKHVKQQKGSDNGKSK